MPFVFIARQMGFLTFAQGTGYIILHIHLVSTE